MEKPISRIHHVTAIASDPQRTLDFYTQVLGLRLVKRTVNFDDPGTYHFYFADAVGTPGTILTFFPWPGAERGRIGSGQVTVTSFSVPEQSIKFWEKRLAEAGVSVGKVGKRVAEETLALKDPDGLKVELIGSVWARENHAWNGSSVPLEHAVRGFHSVTLSEQGYERTAKLLVTMGFRKVAEEGNPFRFEVGEGGAGARADVLCVADAPHGRLGAGTVHHVAWRAVDDEDQKSWRERLVPHDLDVTPVMDRSYFHSIYFREPGGVLFELATDPPGFAIDEPVESLGESLKLPMWLERHRSEIEKALPRSNSGFLKRARNLESPNRKQPVLSKGRPLQKTRGAVILLHGRGASAEDILGLADELQMPEFAYLAPKAAGRTWYPNSFLAPIERNEPWLSSALELVASIIEKLADEGMPHTKVGILGFSQGACLASEFVARNPIQYGGLVALTGGLIGPPGTVFRYSGDLGGHPCFLGSGDPDPHVPWERVKESASILSALGGKLTTLQSLPKRSGIQSYGPGPVHKDSRNPEDALDTTEEQLAEEQSGIMASLGRCKNALSQQHESPTFLNVLTSS